MRGDTITMSNARRTVEALGAARGAVSAAASNAGKHRHRGSGSSWADHISDLLDFATAMEAIHILITPGMVAVVRSCADDVRTQYVHGATPDGKQWPDNV